MPNMPTMKRGMLSFAIVNLAMCAATAAPAPSVSLPPSTAIPVRFVHSVDANKATMGETVTAKTMQVIALPGGQRIAKGTLVTGHVVAVVPFHFDSTPYAHQRPSLLSIHFDKIGSGEAAIPINLSLRAIANANDSKDATYPHSFDDTDHVGEITLVGGTTFSPLDKAILSDDGDAIAYNRKNGVFARLLPAGFSGPGVGTGCAGTDTEQSVAIFSPDACGVYGFGGDYMPENGEGSGTFTLALRGHSVKLYAGSTALLQVNPSN
jgi:hypothetical protein